MHDRSKDMMGQATETEPVIGRIKQADLFWNEIEYYLVPK